VPPLWVKQSTSPRSLRQDALEQIHDAQPVRPETKAIAIQAVALNASDGLNVAPLSLGRLAAATIPLELPQQRVVRGNKSIRRNELLAGIFEELTQCSGGGG